MTVTIYYLQWQVNHTSAYVTNLLESVNDI